MKHHTGSKYYIFYILIFGFVLRVISINQSLWLDEATSALASNLSIKNLFTNFLRGDFHPPLYYLVLKYWVSIFGSSEVSLRMPSVIFGLSTIYTTYFIGKRLFNEKIGLVTALLLATSGFSIYYSQEARMYSMVTFLVSLAIYLFIIKNYIYFSIVIALLGLTDYVALFILPVFWILGYKQKYFVLTLIPLLTSYLFWLPIFIKQLVTGLSIKGAIPVWWNVLGAVTLKNILLIPVKFIIGRISFDDNIIYSLVFIPIFCFFVYFLSKAVKESKLLWFWLLLPIIIGIIIGFKVPTLTYFRFLFCLPPLYLLLAKGMNVFKGHNFKYLSTFAVLINLFLSGFYLFNPTFHREDWRNAVKLIGNKTIILPADSQKEALRYYGKDSGLIYYKNYNGGENEVWLSRYVWEIFDPEDKARRKLENLGYNMVQATDFNGVVFFKYAYK